MPIDQRMSIGDGGIGGDTSAPEGNNNDHNDGYGGFKDYPEPNDSEGLEFSNFNIPNALTTELGKAKKDDKDLLSFYMDFITEVRLGNNNLKMSLVQNVFEDKPQMDIGTNFLNYNSDGTLNLTLGYNFKNGIGVELGTNNEGNIDFSLTFPTFQVGVQLNTKILGERLSQELEKQYMFEIGRWYDEAVRNAYKDYRLP